MIIIINPSLRESKTENRYTNRTGEKDKLLLKSNLKMMLGPVPSLVFEH